MNLDQTTLGIACGLVSLVVGLAAGAISGAIISGKKSKRKISKMLKKAGKVENTGDLIDIIAEKINENENNHFDMNKAIETLSEKSLNFLGKTGYVRFDSTPDISGNLSFSLVLMDENNNGYILTNIHMTEGSSLYLRVVQNGICETNLSPEEEELLHKTKQI